VAAPLRRLGDRSCTVSRGAVGLVRDNAEVLVDRYSERLERAGKVAAAAASIAEARTG